MIQALRTRPYLIALVVVAAIAAAVGVKATSHSIPTGSATVQLMIDSPQSALADLKQDTLPLVARSQVFAQLMSSGSVRDSIAKTAGIPASDITAEGPYSGAGQAFDVPTPSEARGAQLIATNALYHFTFVPDLNIPLVTASVEGPNPAAAGKVANAIVPGVQAWLNQLQRAGNVPAYHRVTIRQLGDAQAGSINSSSGTTLAGIAFAGVLLVGFLVLMTLEGRRKRREAPAEASLPGPAPADAPGAVPLAFYDSAGPPLYPDDVVTKGTPAPASTSAPVDNGNGNPNKGSVHSHLRNERSAAAMEGARRLKDSSASGAWSAGGAHSATSSDQANGAR